ncbi:MAG: peptide-methionine (S)-S-oxide reductase [Candidatus Cloacimonadota bacterium]|nr:MAG: peptide-methionine (S)-S-oxide reductase [Candidatus Cloacimonadota bacterium]
MLETQIAVFGAGCFWCVEAIFMMLGGVISVEPGYAGGTVANPSYEEVCSQSTGHAEVVKIEFDPQIISYEKLLEVFWESHDPTTLYRQGPDIGKQYRSVIFYVNDAQKALAEKYKRKLDESGIFSDPIVTEIEPLDKFYPAENYHRQYFERNKNQPYCRYHIAPKVEKFKTVFKDIIKK